MYEKRAKKTGLRRNGIISKPTRCRGHSKYVWSLLDSSCFYKMKAVINFLRWGLRPPMPNRLGLAILQWNRELNGLTIQYTNLKNMSVAEPQEHIKIKG